MAISPEKLKNDLLSEAEEFEVMIDNQLQKEKLYGRHISITPPARMNSSHFQLIKDRYIAAGWENVIWNDSQHDGPYLSFTSK